MSDRVLGKTFVVTGGASGIGEAISQGLAAEGGNVVVSDLNIEAGRRVAAEIGSGGGAAIAVHSDVTDRDSVRASLADAANEFGRIDGYFNNAGMNAPMNFLDITEDNFMLVMRVNALGVLIGIQEAAKQMIAQQKPEQASPGKIINTASIAGRTGFPKFAPYSAAKAAVISLTQAAARDLAPQGITVNGFAPGVVATPLWDKLDADLARMGAADAGFDSMAADILLGRPAQPADIVPTALFLAAADSDYITGQIIAIEGGMILV